MGFFSYSLKSRATESGPTREIGEAARLGGATGGDEFCKFRFGDAESDKPRALLAGQGLRHEIQGGRSNRKAGEELENHWLDMPSALSLPLTTLTGFLTTT